MDLCLHCDCPATIEVVSGEQLCAACYEAAPLIPSPCPTCSQDATPAGLPVAADDDRPDDAPSASPSALGATIAPVAALGNEAEPTPAVGAAGASFSPVVERVSPSHLLPPESTTGGTLDDMLQALTWCVVRAYDHDAPRGVIDAAERGLTVFGNIVRAVTP